MSVLRDREVDESIKSKRLKDEITLLKLGHSKTIKGLHEDLTLLNVEHSKTIKELEISNETCKNLKNLNETSNLNINALRKEIEMVTKRLTSTFKKLSIDCDSDSDDNEYEFRSISLLSKLIKKINPFPSLISTLETQNSSLMKTNLEIQTKLTSLEATKNNQDSCYKTMEMKLDNLTMDNARFQIEAQLIQNQNGIEKTLQRLENSILMRSEAIVNPETMDFDELNSN
jgi:chromosome segregation ATPase